MERTASQSGVPSPAKGHLIAPRAVRVLAPGSPDYPVYLLLSVVAAGLVIGFVGIWLATPNRWIPPADVAFALLVAYCVGLWLARWGSLRHMAHPQPLEPESGHRVGVATSFVPALEPLPMLEQTLRYLVAMEYPHETWVLDEADSEEVRALCSRLGVGHFTRRHKPGLRTPGGRYAEATKHGNYNAWLDRVGFARYDVVALFDPDHVPEPGYLRETIGHFRDAAVGHVQAPQVYYNQDASFIARGAAEETYRYYSSGLLAGYGLGHTVIVGSHSVHRTSALREVGGLPAHDAEDLYLTREYQAASWRGVYVPRILSMGIAPADWAGYLNQQRRWARALLDLKLRPPRNPSGGPTLKTQVLNLFHGAHYLRPLSLLLLYPLLLALVVTNSVPAFLTPAVLIALGGLALGLALVARFDDRFLLDPEREAGWRWRALVLQLAKAPHFVAALLDAALNRRIGYVTTPKSGGGRGAGALASPHLAIAAVSALTLGIAAVRWGSGLAPVLVGVGAGLVAIPLALAWTAFWTYPPSFESARFEERRRRMGGVLGPQAVAVPPHV